VFGPRTYSIVNISHKICNSWLRAIGTGGVRVGESIYLVFVWASKEMFVFWLALAAYSAVYL
jgi:hypothetical protein